MNEEERNEASGRARPATGRVGPEWAERATSARLQEWSSDRVLDQGDTHDKGEASLCVGEAA